MLSNRRNGVGTAPSVSVVPVAGSAAGWVTPLTDQQIAVGALNAAIARTRGNPAGRRRAEIGEDREDLVRVVRIGRSQADDRTGVDQTVEDRAHIVRAWTRPPAIPGWSR